MSKPRFLVPVLTCAILFIILYSQLCDIRTEIYSISRAERETAKEHEKFVKKQSEKKGSGSSENVQPTTAAVGKGKSRIPRILCWVLTGVANHMTKAIHVKQTWGQRCDVLLFMSSQHDEVLGSIALPGVKEGHDKLWPKTQKAFQYVWKHHRDDADWFLKADDDTYVLTENLRSFLSRHDPNEPRYFGLTENYGNGTVINLGGAGYVVSKKALRLFIKEALPNPEKCHTEIRPLHRGDEDIEFGLCLQAVGVLPIRPKDEKGRHLFRQNNPLRAIDEIKGDYKKWQEVGRRFPEQSISFHYVKPEEMYVFELLVNYFKQK